MAKSFELNRRQFLGAAGIAAAGVAAAGVLSSCSSEESSSSESSESSEGSSSTAAAAEPDSVDETYDCDLLVIGSGASGLAACVEAGEAGIDTICLESLSSEGGNANLFEGIFGSGSQMAKDAGIEAETGDFARREILWGHYRVDGRLYRDLIAKTGENIDWLVDHGVQFGQVYEQIGYLKTFHEFASGHGAEDYVPFMYSAAEDAGVKFYFNTHADSLICDGNKVTGCYATNTEDKTTIQVNAKAVIMATGGWMANAEKQKEGGLNPDLIAYIGQDGSDGSGNDMGRAIGVANNIDKAAPQLFGWIHSLPGQFEGGKFVLTITAIAPYAIWVNENGERYINEDISLMANENCSIFDCGIPSMLQDAVYVIFDQAMMDSFIAGDADTQQELDDGIANGDIFQADTISELAAAAGFDEDLFTETIEEYNQSCADGVDHEFGKYQTNTIMYEVPIDSLIAFENAPYYAMKIIYGMAGCTGSLKTNRDFQAVDDDGNAFDGLYIVGVEGTMLWANAYNTYAGGSCAANNVNSGRMAVKHAQENYL